MVSTEWGASNKTTETEIHLFIIKNLQSGTGWGRAGVVTNAGGWVFPFYTSNGSAEVCVYIQDTRTAYANGMLVKNVTAHCVRLWVADDGL